MRGNAEHIWIPAKIAFEIFKKSLFGKNVGLTLILQEETNDTYYYVNGKYIGHKYYNKYKTKKEEVK